jgi:hypothetical protein
VSVSSRDKKVLLAIIPLALIVGYWFLVLGPKRADATKASDSLAKQERRLDDARANLAAAESSKNTFASDYTALVKLGKAVPTKLDMPTVIVQLHAAARGTGISFTKIAAGEREPTAGGDSTAQPPAAPGGAAAAGGAPAQSAPGGGQHRERRQRHERRGREVGRQRRRRPDLHHGQAGQRSPGRAR